MLKTHSDDESNEYDEYDERWEREHQRKTQAVGHESCFLVNREASKHSKKQPRVIWYMEELTQTRPMFPSTVVIKSSTAGFQI